MAVWRKAIQKTGIGYGFGFSYCVITALSVVYIFTVNQSVNPILSELVCFTFSLVWFNVINYRHWSVMYRACWQNKKDWLMVNLSTVLIWFSTFFALTYIDPVLLIAISMSVIPLTSYLSSLYYRTARFSWSELAFIAAILVLLIWLVMVAFHEQYRQHPWILGKGIVFAFLLAVGGGWYLADSKVMQDNGHLKSSQMLAVRFYLLLIICLIWAILNHTLHSIPFLPYRTLGILSLLTAILPMFCLQKALHRIGAVPLSFLMPCTPILTYGILALLGQQQNIQVFIILVLLALILILHALAAHKKSVSNGVTSK